MKVVWRKEEKLSARRVKREMNERKREKMGENYWKDWKWRNSSNNQLNEIEWEESTSEWMKKE